MTEPKLSECPLTSGDIECIFQHCAGDLTRIMNWLDSQGKPEWRGWVPLTDELWSIHSMWCNSNNQPVDSDSGLTVMLVDGRIEILEQ